MFTDLGISFFAQLVNPSNDQEAPAIQTLATPIPNESEERSLFTEIFLRTIHKEIMNSHTIVLETLKGYLKIDLNLDKKKTQESLERIFTKALNLIPLKEIQNNLSYFQKLESQLKPEYYLATCCTIDSDRTIFQINQTVLKLLGKRKSKAMIKNFLMNEILEGKKMKIVHQCIDNANHKMLSRYFKN